MKYIEFDESRPMDLVLLGRVAIDFNPAYNDQVKEEFKPLKKVHMFEKFVGGSPANIAVGVTKHGLKAGFIGKVSDDQFGEYVVDYFDERGIDTSQITKCTNGEKLGLILILLTNCKNSAILTSEIRNSSQERIDTQITNKRESTVSSCKVKAQKQKKRSKKIKPSNKRR